MEFTQMNSICNITRPAGRNAHALGACRHVMMHSCNKKLPRVGAAVCDIYFKY